MECNCRCIKCKSTGLISNDFTANDGYNDSHHTCLSCGTHFDHLDGEQFEHCNQCGFDKDANFKS